MRIILIISMLCLPFYSRPCFAGDAWAILSQTAIQTAEHLKRLNEAIRQIEMLKKQVELAVEAAKGIDGVDFISDFRNLVLETNDLLGDLDGYINGDELVSDEWKGIFGSLDEWVEKPKEEFESIAMSDDVNSVSYKIADTYQDLYQKNSEYAQRFITHSKDLNEKGALKQIAEELGHLMQLQNHTIYLMSQNLKQQSVEQSNQNLLRKESIIFFEKDNEGVRKLIRSGNRKFEM